MMRRGFHESGDEYVDEPYDTANDFLDSTELFWDDWWAIDLDALDEVWCPIYEFPGYYVSDYGRVWSSNTHHFIKPAISSNGYLFVGLHKNGKQYTRRLHRLIAEAFVYNPDPDNYDVVRHLDDQMYNNEVGNLAWGTHADNTRDCIKNGRFHPIDDAARAKSIEKTSKPVMAIDLARGIEIEYSSVVAAARGTGLSMSSVYNCLVGKRVAVKGWTFRYINRRR